jgi:hypothetical protein
MSDIMEAGEYVVCPVYMTTHSDRCKVAGQCLPLAEHLHPACCCTRVQLLSACSSLCAVSCFPYCGTVLVVTFLW